MLEAIQKFFPWASQLAPLPKVLLSLAVAVLAALILAVIWIQPPSDKLNTGAVAMWPSNKSLNGLKARLDTISKDNARLLTIVAQSGRYGIYADDLAKKLGVPRDEAVYRAQALQTEGLVEISPLTDINFRLDPRISLLFSETPARADATTQFIVAYLK